MLFLRPKMASHFLFVDTRPSEPPFSATATPFRTPGCQELLSRHSGSSAESPPDRRTGKSTICVRLMEDTSPPDISLDSGLFQSMPEGSIAIKGRLGSRGSTAACRGHLHAVSLDFHLIAVCIFTLPAHNLLQHLVNGLVPSRQGGLSEDSWR